MKTAIVFVLVTVVAAASAAYYYGAPGAEQPAGSFRTAAITRGDLVSTIAATGTLQAEELINVGAQVGGKITAFGVDPADPNKRIDFNSVVHEGTVLAYIDDSTYKAQLNQAEAAHERARADLLQAEANLLQTKAVLYQTGEEWRRAQTLLPQKAIAETDYITAAANYRAADANVKAAEAMIAVAKASVKQSAAALDLARTNLAYTVIKSPVEGVIIARRVNIGQTVVAALNAPSLFLIAKDLRRMEVWASVNEADIGRLRVGMPASFTVDAFPGETFRGQVTQIRMNAEMTQNVVLYTVIVTTDNPDGKLLPSLTANIQFEVQRRTDVLMAPNAALRWLPESSRIAPDVAEEDSTSTGGEADAARLWTPDGGLVRPLDVLRGPTDGTMTEVSGEGVKEGTVIVVGDLLEEEVAEDQGTTNPFLPKLRGRRSTPPPPP